MKNELVLSGIRPTGDLHLGNYKGAIEQFLELAKKHSCNFFVADGHALTEATSKTGVASLSVEAVKMFLACGLEPSKSVVIYRQSDVPQIFYISALLSTCFKVGRLLNGTTFKDRLSKIKKEDGEVSASLLTYPIWMAADILGVRGNIVPVGADQIQHIEMAREAVKTFNHRFGDVLTVPRANLNEPIRVPGIDGSEKMGKSDGNTIALMESGRSILRKINKIPTQAETGQEMTQGTKALFQFVELFCDRDVVSDYRQRFESGEQKFFGDLKKILANRITELVSPIQNAYRSISNDFVNDILSDGAKVAQTQASGVLEEMQKAMGLRVT